MSDDERYDSDREEDEEEHAEDADYQDHRTMMREAKRWIRMAVANRKGNPLTKEDVDQFLYSHRDLVGEANDNMPTLLHAIFDLVISDDDEKIQSKTVKLLVERVVEKVPRLLCTLNDKQHNPLYLAITNRKKVLADLMVRSCPDEPAASQCLADALEHTCGNEKRKTCLHLAFELDLKPATLMRMLKNASSKALASVDITGRRPMHYAVHYSRCDVGIVSAFIEKDNEALRLQKDQNPNQPPKTFLDVDGEVKRSVYQEHVATIPADDEIIAKKDTSEDKKKKKQEQPQAAQGKSEPKAMSRQEQPSSTAARDTRDAPERGSSRRDRDREKKKDEDDGTNERERIRRQLKEQEALERSRQQGLGQTPAAARDKSRDRQNLDTGGKTVGEPLYIQTARATMQVPAAARAGSDIAANTPLRRAPTIPIDISEDKTENKSKKPPTSTKKPRRSTKADPEISAATSKIVLRLLKLHYMRTRSIQKATSWLYGTNPKDVQIFFDYQGLPLEVKEELFNETFRVTKFDEVLKFVRFTNVTVKRRITPQNKAQLSSGGLGRQDMEFFLDFLYKKGVRYILKVVVEETGRAVHSNKAIKNALDKMMIEHLDWQKMDMDPQIICGISSQAQDSTLDKEELEKGSRNKLRELDLRWGGNNAILRAWSEPQGLPLLQHLETVNIIVPPNTDIYDSPEWIHERKDEFEQRLNDNVAAIRNHGQGDSSPLPVRQRVVVHLRGVSTTPHKKAAAGVSKNGTQGQAPIVAQKKVITSHEWLKCMEKFATNINPFWSKTRDRFQEQAGVTDPGIGEERIPRSATVTGLENDIVVALIDDGVALVDHYFAGRVLEGKTFDYSESGVGQYYNSAHGHGTEMARFILRVCPMAKIYPIRLKTHLSQDGENQIDLESAALAIEAALEKKATIISMSWTIPLPRQPNAASQRFEKAVREACSRKVLMFGSSPDEGQFTDHVYPTAVERSKMFRIGAAHDDGTAFSYAGKDVDFIFPGVNVNVNTTISTAGPSGTLREITGSSVATALAAGLAATIIYCFKVSALAVKTRAQLKSYGDVFGPEFTEAEVTKIAQHAAMKAAFGRIGEINEGRFIQVWETFDPAAQELEDQRKSDDDKVKCVMRLCSKLMVHEVR